MKKTHQKVAYWSRISVVSEIFPYFPTAQMAEFMFPNVVYRATSQNVELVKLPAKFRTVNPTTFW